MEDQEVCIKFDTIILVGDSRVQYVVPSFRAAWPHNSTVLASKESDVTYIDNVIKLIDEELCKTYDGKVLIIVFGLHCDMMMLINHDYEPNVQMEILGDLVKKINSATERWIKINPDYNFLWCLPSVPDFKRYNNKKDKKYVPYRENDILEIKQVRKYFHNIKELKQIWENEISLETCALLDLNMIGLAASSIANPQRTFAKFEDVEKLPSFVASQTIDGLHPTPKMAVSFWNYVLRCVNQSSISPKKFITSIVADIDLESAAADLKLCKRSKHMSDNSYSGDDMDTSTVIQNAEQISSTDIGTSLSIPNDELMSTLEDELDYSPEKENEAFVSTGKDCLDTPSNQNEGQLSSVEKDLEHSLEIKNRENVSSRDYFQTPLKSQNTEQVSPVEDLEYSTETKNEECVFPSKEHIDIPNNQNLVQLSSVENDLNNSPDFKNEKCVSPLDHLKGSSKIQNTEQVSPVEGLEYSPESQNKESVSPSKSQNAKQESPVEGLEYSPESQNEECVSPAKSKNVEQVSLVKDLEYSPESQNEEHGSPLQDSFDSLSESQNEKQVLVTKDTLNSSPESQNKVSETNVNFDSSIENQDDDLFIETDSWCENFENSVKTFMEDKNSENNHEKIRKRNNEYCSEDEDFYEIDESDDKFFQEVCDLEKNIGKGDSTNTQIDLKDAKFAKSVDVTSEKMVVDLKSDDKIRISKGDSSLTSSLTKPEIKEIYDRVTIIADPLYKPFLEHLKKPKVMLLYGRNAQVGHIEEFLTMKKERLTKNTLYIFVFGIYSMTNSAILNDCKQSLCKHPLKGLHVNVPITLKNTMNEVNSFIKKLFAEIDSVKSSLPANSDIAILPPLPISLISVSGGLKHGQLHKVQSLYPKYLIAQKISLVSRIYPLCMEKVTPLSISSLVACCSKLQPVLNQVPVKFERLEPLRCSSSDKPEFNDWMRNVGKIINTLLSNSVAGVDVMKPSPELDGKMQTESNSETFTLKSPKIFKYDQIAIVADRQDASFVNDFAKGSEVVVLADLDMQEISLKDFLLKKKSQLSKKTLYLLVIGINSITKTGTATACQQEGCANPLQSLEPLTLDMFDKFIDNEFLTLSNSISNAKQSLPLESNIEVLPAIPASFIAANDPHDRLHMKKTICPNYFITKWMDIIETLFPLWSKKISVLTNLNSLVSKCCKIYPDLFDALSSIKEIEVMNCSAFEDIPSYNKWKEVVHKIIDIALCLSTSEEIISTALRSRANSTKLGAPIDEIKIQLDDVIKFTRTILEAKKIRKQEFDKHSYHFDNIFIVSNQQVLERQALKNPFSKCNFDSKMIYQRYNNYDDNDVNSLLKIMGNFSSKSVCCLMFDLSVIGLQKSEMQTVSENSSDSNTPVRLINALQDKTFIDFNNIDELEVLVKNELITIDRFIRKLSKEISVIILPLLPDKIFCDDLNSPNCESRIFHVRGSYTLWKRAVQLLISSWNDLMEKNNREFDTFNYSLIYKNSELETAPIVRQLCHFPIWNQPAIWRAFAETLLLSLASRSASTNVSRTERMSNKMYLAIKQISPMIPHQFLTELFQNLDENVVIEFDKDRCKLRRMKLSVALKLIKKFEEFRFGGSKISGILVGAVDESYDNSDLIMNLFVSAVFEKVYSKWMPQISETLLEKLDVPDLATLKVNPCQKGTKCDGITRCPYYHSPSDQRRNPLMYKYNLQHCLHAKSKDGSCSLPDAECNHSRNEFEVKFHPSTYQFTYCSSSETSEICNERELCPNAHMYSPEIFFTSEWKDLVVTGADQTLRYFIGAIKSSKKVEPQHKLRILLISLSVNFLEFAFNESRKILNRFGLNASILKKGPNKSETSEVLLGNPSSFMNILETFNGMRGIIIVDDIRKIMTNSTQFDRLKKFFRMINLSHDITSNIVFVNFRDDYMPNTIVQKLSNSFDRQLRLASISVDKSLDRQKVRDESSDIKSKSSRGMKRSRSIVVTQNKRGVRSGSKEKFISESSGSFDRDDSFNLKWRGRLGPKLPENTRQSGSKSRFERKRHISESESIPSAVSKVRRTSEVTQPSHSMPFNYSGYQNSNSSFDANLDDIRKNLGTILYDEYVLELENLKLNFEKEFLVFKNVPELCPHYESCLDSFRVMYARQHSGKGEEHKWNLWRLFWDTKLDEMKNESWQLKQRNLLDEFYRKVSDISNNSRQSFVQQSNRMADFEMKDRNFCSSDPSFGQHSNNVGSLKRRVGQASTSGLSFMQQSDQFKDFEIRPKQSDQFKDFEIRPKQSDQFKDFEIRPKQSDQFKDFEIRPNQSSVRQSNRITEYERKANQSYPSGQSFARQPNRVEQIERKERQYDFRSPISVQQSNHMEGISRKVSHFSSSNQNSFQHQNLKEKFGVGGRLLNPVSSVALKEKFGVGGRLLNPVSSVAEASSFEFVDTLSMLEKLCDLIGFLGPSLKSMVSSCRALGSNTVEAYNVFTGVENVMVVNAVLEKVKTLSLSATGGKLLLLQKAVNWIPKLLKEAKNGPKPKSNFDSEKIPIDIDAIAKVSLGKPSTFTLNLIKTALSYEGIPNHPNELVNSLFLKVCEIHFKLTMDE